jgi:hypothetical protein
MDIHKAISSGISPENGCRKVAAARGRGVIVVGWQRWITAKKARLGEVCGLRVSSGILD